MKIAVVTNYDKKNYGSILQCYALQSKLKELGADETVVFVKPIKKRTFLQRIKIFLGKSKNNYTLKDKYRIKKAQKLFNAKYAKINNFCSKYLKTVQGNSDKEIENLSRYFDIFIAGSDQIWSPKSGALSHFTLLDFINTTSIKKYSYAASIGVESLSQDEKELFRDSLNRFEQVSVREETAQKVLKDCTDKNVRVDVDPTLLYGFVG